MDRHFPRTQFHVHTHTHIHKHRRIPAVWRGPSPPLSTGMQGKREKERERERKQLGLSPGSQKKEGERKQTVGATEDRNKYRRRENGWVVLCMGSFLFPTVEMTHLLLHTVWKRPYGMKQKKIKTMRNVSERLCVILYHRLYDSPVSVLKAVRSCLEWQKRVSLSISPSTVCQPRSVSVSLSVKVNGVSPELTAVATGAPIDPTHSHQCCFPYGTAEGVCVCVIGISRLDCDSVCGMCAWVSVCGLFIEPAADIQGYVCVCMCVCVIVEENLSDISKLAMSSQSRGASLW